MNLQEKLDTIYNTITEVQGNDPVVGNILLEGFSLSLNLLKEVSENNGRPIIDVSQHLEIIARVLGIDLEVLVKDIIENNFGAQDSTKEPDSATLDFITSDLDDYEKFLAQNKAKEDLSFLSKEI